MGLDYELSDGIVRITATGKIDFDSGLAVLRTALDEARESGAAGPAKWHVLLDFRNSTESRPVVDLQRLARFIAAERTILSGRCAVLTGDPLHYGIARMFGVFMETEGLDCIVFTDGDEAGLWLGPQ